MAFPDAWLNELLAKNDIVAVISSYMELKPKGRRLWGLCPLHGEKTASFSVSPDKQLFYCFGCHAGGSVIQFIMDMERLSFPEAVKFLADRVGMQMPEEGDDGTIQKERAYRDRLYQALKLAARYYMQTLLSPAGQAGQQFFLKRGLSSDAVKRFGLGYAPDSWDGIKSELMQAGFTERELVDAGLLVENVQKHSTYDAYRGRVIFPIQGTNGKVLGFGARVLGDGKPKYINTGDTPVYNKRNNLYGLHLMKGKKLDDLIIVEGYMDVIGLYEAGVDNAVASLGTALTQQQARLLKRYVERVFIAYDGDAAGQQATLRGLDILKSEGLDVRVIVFPDGLDPDEFIRQRGREAFDRRKEQALSLNAFKLVSMQREFSMEDGESREQFTKKACAFIGTLEPVERGRQLTWLSKQTGYDEDVLRAQADLSAGRPVEKVRPFPTSARRARQDNPFTPVETARTRAENELLNVMLQSREAAEEALRQGAMDLFSDEAFRNFALGIVTAYASDEVPNAPRILTELGAREAGKLSGVLKQDADYPEPVQLVTGCIERIRKYDLKQEMDQIRNRLDHEPMSEGEKRSLNLRYIELKRQLG